MRGYPVEGPLESELSSTEYENCPRSIFPITRTSPSFIRNRTSTSGELSLAILIVQPAAGVTFEAVTVVLVHVKTTLPPPEVTV